MSAVVLADTEGTQYCTILWQKDRQLAKSILQRMKPIFLLLTSTTNGKVTILNLNT